MDACLVDHHDRPVVVLGADKGQSDRSPFDAAHELGHLVLHRPEHAGTREVETQAHRFAAAFLMPADAIRNGPTGSASRTSSGGGVSASPRS